MAGKNDEEEDPEQILSTFTVVSQDCMPFGWCYCCAWRECKWWVGVNLHLNGTWTIFWDEKKTSR